MACQLQDHLKSHQSLSRAHNGSGNGGISQVEGICFHHSGNCEITDCDRVLDLDRVHRWSRL